MVVMTNRQAQEIYVAARDKYLAEHPAPEKTDVACPRCGAAPGEPCTWKRKPPVGWTVHRSRETVWAKEWNKAQRAAIDYGWDVENAAWRSAT